MLRPKSQDERPREFSSEPWNRYTELRAKGADENLSAEDFRHVIDCEMTLSVAANAPIRRVFDADAELKSLRSLPHDQKKAALDIFKDKLVRQRKAFMQCRLFIERTVQHDPDVDTERLKDIGDFFADRYGFSDVARGTVHDIVYEYKEKHEKTLAFREKYPDDTALIRELSHGTVTASDVEVSVGPVSIDIVADRPTAEQLRMVTGKASDTTKTVYGFLAHDNRNDVYYSVVVRDVPNVDRVHVHEQEHAKNRVLSEFFDLLTVQKYSVENIRVRISNEADAEVRSQLREEELLMVRDKALDAAKDELTAMLKDARSEDIARFERLYDKTGGSYDYLKEKRDTYYKDPDYAELAHELFVQEYNNIIEEAILSFRELRALGGYSVDESLALLTDMPLDEWPNTTRHLLDHRRVRN